MHSTNTHRCYIHLTSIIWTSCFLSRFVKFHSAFQKSKKSEKFKTTDGQQACVHNSTFKYSVQVQLKKAKQKNYSIVQKKIRYHNFVDNLDASSRSDNACISYRI